MASASGPESESTRECEPALPAPDADGALAPATALRYNDAPWLAAPDGVRLAHPKLPPATAEAIGIRSLRLALLSESSEELGMQLHDSAEAFGQHEALTTRLKHILDAYADGPGVISELVQNADDAGATEVRLMLDSNPRGTKSLLGPRLAEWQGPALVAWNDAVFSPSDFHNIARIGQDSKIDAPAAAGRFGLGFNAVYHFTDVPSFVSGEYLVMFDPHATHLPGATPARPGLKIAFAASPLLSQFPDQFAGYLGTFGCDLTRPYPATMFRFPLRSENAAKASEIKPEAYTADDVRRLFEQFRPRAAQTLLFLKNVRKISVYERGGETDAGDGSDEPRLLYEASIPAFEDGNDPRATVLRWVAGAAGEVAGAKRRAFFDRLRDVPEASLPSSVGWMDLTVRSRATEDEDTERDEHAVFAGQSGSPSGSSPRFRVHRERWMVCSSLAGGAARALALSDVGTRRGLVPWVGVAARVPHPDDGPTASRPEIDGRAFCFLPLPARTGFPVHVNAYFELSSNRRDIWFGEDMSGGGAARSEWNRALLEHAVAPAYARLLARAAVALGSVPAYYALFPVATSAAEPWSLALPPLYASLARLETLRATDPRSNIARWTAPRSAFFPDPSGDASPALAAALRAEGARLIEDAPADVRAAFASRAGNSCRFLSPATVRALLRESRPHPSLDFARERARAVGVLHLGRRSRRRVERG